MMVLSVCKKDHGRLKRKGSRKKSQGGFTLLEVLVAITVLAFGILAVGSMQVSSIRQNAHADQVTEASVLARDCLERLIALPYTDDDLDENTYEDDNPPAGYTIDWVISDGCTSGCSTPANTKLITVTVAHDGLNRDIVLVNVKPAPP